MGAVAGADDFPPCPCGTRRETGPARLPSEGREKHGMKRQDMNKPTLRTVAEHTGFAVTTVSRALADDPRIAAKTRAKVAAAAKALGYIPDRAAQRLRTGRTQVISVVLDPHSEILGYSGTLISGAAEALRGTRFHIAITQYPLDEDPLAPIRHIVRNRLADGVMMARTRPFDARVSFLMESDFPFVTHGRTEWPKPHPWVDYDNDRFAWQAVHMLAARGCRRISIIPPSPDFTFHRHMTEGFRRAVAETGVAADVPGDVDLNAAPEAIAAHYRRRLAAPDRPDGVICPGEMAAMAVNAAAIDSGLVVGRDIALVAKQTSALFDLHRPRLETIYEDIAAAGRAMAELLLRRIAGEDPSGLHVLHVPEDAVPSARPARAAAHAARDPGVTVPGEAD